MGCTRFPGPRRAPVTVMLGLATAGLLAFGLSRARAADAETRVFTVRVDGKKAGEYRLAIQPQADGSVTVSAQSDVRVSVLGVAVYTYRYTGREVWKGGRLQHLESSGQEKGKAFAVCADADGQALRVRANGQERRARPDVWTTSCWRLPEARFRNGDVPLLGCDNGAETQGRLQYVGSEQLQVAGQAQTCSHYRVMKDVPHDLWYDAQERLVRDEWVSGGHRTVVELAGLGR